MVRASSCRPPVLFAVGFAGKQAAYRFLAADSARRSELAEMSAACSNLPFLITPRDLSPIGLLLALRDAALRLHAATVNPAASPPVSGV